VTDREVLVDCLRRLNGLELCYMVTGSMASNFWGIPRTSHDVDIVIQLPPSSIEGLVTAFQGDFYLDTAQIRSAYQPPYQFNAIDTRSNMKVDFWILRPAPFEREMFARRVQVRVFGEPAWVSTAEDVILHKLYWHKITPSDRQLGDAAGVVAIQEPSLDQSYMRRWAAEIGVADVLEDLLAGRIKPKTT
jgi:hypothetical protein